MKFFLLLFGLMALSINSESQTIKDYDICKYKIAYNYLFNDSILYNDSVNFNGLQLSKRTTVVSDSIVYIHKFTFYKQYKNQNETDRDAATRIGELDNMEWFSPVYSSLISDVFPNKNIQNPLFILYFSKVENNILLCELMPLHKPENYSYLKNAYYNQSYTYLFLFDENDIIKTVEKEIIAYN